MLHEPDAPCMCFTFLFKLCFSVLCFDLSKNWVKIVREKMRSFWQAVEKICGLEPKIFLLSNKITFSVKKYLVIHSSYSRTVKCEVQQTRLIECVNWLHQFSNICYFSQHGSIYESELVNWSTFNSFAYLIFITCRDMSVSHLKLRQLISPILIAVWKLTQPYNYK